MKSFDDILKIGYLDSDVFQGASHIFGIFEIFTIVFKVRNTWKVSVSNVRFFKISSQDFIFEQISTRTNFCKKIRILFIKNS